MVVKSSLFKSDLQLSFSVMICRLVQVIFSKTKILGNSRVFNTTLEFHHNHFAGLYIYRSIYIAKTIIKSKKKSNITPKRFEQWSFH